MRQFFQNIAGDETKQHEKKEKLSDLHSLKACLCHVLPMIFRGG